MSVVTVLADNKTRRPLITILHFNIPMQLVVEFILEFIYRQQCKILVVLIKPLKLITALRVSAY
jgi:hypothetical protein